MTLVVVGKRGKMEERRQSRQSPRGVSCSSLPREVRHSLGNGAMEKGASASALSSTSGDEIVGSPFLEVRLRTPVHLLPLLWDRVNPGLTLMPGKQAKSLGMELMENNFVSKWDARRVVDPRPYDHTPELQQNGEKNQQEDGLPQEQKPGK